ncbi:MAG: N-6 DNA methylase [Limnochordaceae bacterium]|nr:N-6 DNA methylase [Limnochordaceae bacterium]
MAARPPELYSEQDVVAKVILPELARLGYNETDPGKHVTIRFTHPIIAHQGREKKTLFADLVVFIRDVPVIVIDAKNPRQYLNDNDKEQVISYARLLGDIAPYSALCNGTWAVYDSITKQQLPGLPTYDGLLGDQQRRRVTARQRAVLVRQATRTLFAIESARELSRLMRRCHDVIRNLKGYDPTKAFDELSKVLFCKMYEEREVEEGRRSVNRFTTQVVKEMREQGVEIIQNLWRDTISSDRYREVFADQQGSDGIELPAEAIDKIVAILENRSLTLTDLDVKGVAFEEFLAATYRGGGLGQYFTPREVVRFMVDLADPAIGEKVIDPACGTGGFLIRTYDVVSNKIETSELSSKEKERLRRELANQCLVGIDWEPRAARTCKMNMIIHGDGHAGVYHANALDLEEVRQKVSQRRMVYPSAPAVEEGIFDLVLTNPPFGAVDSTDRILGYYQLGRGRKTQKREILLIERCIRLLRPGGRMVIVLPEGILSNKQDQDVRDYITEHCIVKAIIRLPQDAFKMSEGAACTSIMYAVKKDPGNPILSEQGDVFFARAEYIGISPSGKPVEENDLLSIRDQFRKFEAGEWDELELEMVEEETVQFVREADGSSGPWLEPEVNRTSLLYDRLCYVVRRPRLTGRFSYTFFHPAYYRVMQALRKMPVELRSLQSLCQEGYPVRGKKPSEESAEGIPVIKLRNVTGQGIDPDTDYAPDTEETWKESERGIVRKGDVLVTSTGEGTIGRVDIYPYDEPAICDNHVAICRVKDGINARYLVEFLRSEYGQIQMLRYVSGSTGQTELNIEHLASVQVPVPSDETQEAIARLMDDARQRATELRKQAAGLQERAAYILADARASMYRLIADTPVR